MLYQLNGVGREKGGRFAFTRVRTEDQVCHVNALSQHESILVDSTHLLKPRCTNGISPCCLNCSVSCRAMESLLIFRAAGLVAAL